MRKALPALLALLAAVCLLALAGCTRLQEGEYASSRQHESAADIDVEDAELTLEAQDYAGLLDAVSTFIEQGVERGPIRVTSYDGDVEADLADACLSASTETPLGAYCVYFINYSVDQVMSVVDANVSIIYRHAPGSAAFIPVCGDEETLDGLIAEAVTRRADTLTLRAGSGSLDSDAVARAVETAYYSNPGAVLYIPTYSLSSYPETGPDRILELVFSYPYATSTVEQRRRVLDQKADEIVASLPQGNAETRLLAMADYFSENVVYDTTVNASDDQARRYNAMTAYGALSQGRAVGEGYAMGLKVLCDLEGIECTVIRGRFNNIDHAWNLVRLSNGELYHLDLTVYDPAGAVFKNDDQQRYANYWWDATLYPWCSGPSLYGPEFDPPETGNPGPSVPPAGWSTDEAAGETQAGSGEEGEDE